MDEVQVEITVGDVSFDGTFPGAWVVEQLERFLATAGSDDFSWTPAQDWGEQDLDKILIKAAEMLRGALLGDIGPTVIEKQPLPSFLAKYNAAPERRKFLATAIWLHVRGKTLIEVSDVNNALKDAEVAPLNNPAATQIYLKADGFFSKAGNGFFVTSKGYEELKQSASEKR